VHTGTRQSQFLSHTFSMLFILFVLPLFLIASPMRGDGASSHGQGAFSPGNDGSAFSGNGRQSDTRQGQRYNKVDRQTDNRQDQSRSGGRWSDGIPGSNSVDMAPTQRDTASGAWHTTRNTDRNAFPELPPFADMSTNRDEAPTPRSSRFTDTTQDDVTSQPRTPINADQNDATPPSRPTRRTRSSRPSHPAPTREQPAHRFHGHSHRSGSVEDSTVARWRTYSDQDYFLMGHDVRHIDAIPTF
jgi:hypothetical protein